MITWYEVCGVVVWYEVGGVVVWYEVVVNRNMRRVSHASYSQVSVNKIIFDCNVRQVAVQTNCI